MLVTIKDRYAKAIAEPEHSFEYRAEAIADNGRQPPGGQLRQSAGAANV